MNRKLFLAWQDPHRRRWFPVGQLVSQGGEFRFTYTKGALEAQQSGGFKALPSFPDLDRVYVSTELFPLFSNRSLRQTRPDYKQYLEWLCVPESEADPVAILARSGGQRVTDTLEVFPAPVKSATGEHELHFLVHGLSHMVEEAVFRAERLTPGERLLVMWDMQNPKHNHALALRTAETFDRDMFLVGYCPRYLSGDIIETMKRGEPMPIVTLERVNRSPAPLQFRLLCKLVMPAVPGFSPFSSDEYTPLATEGAELELTSR